MVQDSTVISSEKRPVIKYAFYQWGRWHVHQWFCTMIITSLDFAKPRNMVLIGYKNKAINNVTSHISLTLWLCTHSPRDLETFLRCCRPDPLHWHLAALGLAQLWETNLSTLFIILQQKLMIILHFCTLKIVSLLLPIMSWYIISSQNLLTYTLDHWTIALCIVWAKDFGLNIYNYPFILKFVGLKNSFTNFTWMEQSWVGPLGLGLGLYWGAGAGVL